jgi:hypothetical protein
MHKFSRKKKTSKVKNVERKNIESAVNAILTQAIHEK